MSDWEERREGGREGGSLERKGGDGGSKKGERGRWGKGKRE